MGNPFFVPGDRRAVRVNDLFTRIAPRYDLINDVQSLGLHRLWKRRLLREADIQPGIRALDVCCGTGDVALALARRGARVTGLDFSLAMLAVGQQRARHQGTAAESPARLHRKATGLLSGATGQRKSGDPADVQFLAGDGLRLPFRDAGFEVVTISYGLRNLASLEGGLREMLRVAKPRGRILVLDFARPGNALWRGIYLGYLGLIVPLLGRVLCGNREAYAYILESLKHFPSQTVLADLMRRSGCKNVRYVDLLGGVMSIHCGEKSA